MILWQPYYLTFSFILTTSKFITCDQIWTTIRTQTIHFKQTVHSKPYFSNGNSGLLAPEWNASATYPRLSFTAHVQWAGTNFPTLPTWLIAQLGLFQRLFSQPLLGSHPTRPAHWNFLNIARLLLVGLFSCSASSQGLYLQNTQFLY